jgi:hypothetical protein
MWQENLSKSIVVCNLTDVPTEKRAATIKRWTDGVLLTSPGILPNIKQVETFLQPDVLVLDEAHKMIQNPNSNAFRMLKAVAPARIIGRSFLRSRYRSNLTISHWSLTHLSHAAFAALTGSPFQNNVSLISSTVCVVIRRAHVSCNSSTNSFI